MADTGIPGKLVRTSVSWLAGGFAHHAMDKAQFPNNRRRAIAPLTAAAVRHRDTVIYVNPGSAGPRRFSLLISVGELMVDEDGGISARTVELVVPKRI